MIILSLISLIPLAFQHIHGVLLSPKANFPQGNSMAVNPPVKSYAPLQLASAAKHPVDQLMQTAEGQFTNLQNRQSKSLAEAATEYRRRYNMHPPPNFDRWYEFATRRGVQLIDEFDTIHQSILPFWGLEPATIRSRVREAMGNPENFLMSLLIRNGEAVKVERAEEWQQKATIGMMQQFLQFLPDMDLVFNIHDEPRVIVPHDRLAQLVHVAQNERIPRAFANAAPKNTFSSRPKDMNDGKSIDEVTVTRFNVFPHQPTWTHSRMSCSLDSPARAYEEMPLDNLTSYALTDIGIVYNQTAFEDVCMSPTLKQTFGFFDRPNAYNLVLELFPVFSQSKISSYQDIIYPSPWYWSEKVGYDENREFEWDQKNNSLYWRGSTTGGFSKHGGWRRQHRQRVVQKMNALDKTKILSNVGNDITAQWQLKEIQRSDYRELVDVHFSHVGQCEEADCNAQKEFFQVGERVDGQDAWGWKHLLDIDGNAFSGRFYAFLKSKSAVYKMSVFQEWHKDWLKPWLHYVPLSLRGDEWMEIVRYFGQEEEGTKHAHRLAMQGREWANKVLRKEDFEAWFFRLLLE
jgi:hypothetical protein